MVCKQVRDSVVVWPTNQALLERRHCFERNPKEERSRYRAVRSTILVPVNEKEKDYMEELIQDERAIHSRNILLKQPENVTGLEDGYADAEKGLKIFGYTTSYMGFAHEV